ncbi:unnamed protein product [Paramecium sonneborni]|uniref:Transmembrane protein n=1 Tax=Paramecium sonneborni TaxID=65129 RepID=A0A8S1QTP6_9CILI|nr:unnamed protein product [Paramecium sonneborni]
MYRQHKQMIQGNLQQDKKTRIYVFQFIHQYRKLEILHQQEVQFIYRLIQLLKHLEQYTQKCIKIQSLNHVKRWLQIDRTNQKRIMSYLKSQHNKINILSLMTLFHYVIYIFIRVILQSLIMYQH